MTIKAVIFDMGGVILPAPMHYWKSIEKTHNLRDGSVVETIISKDFYPHFKLFETGRLTSEDLDPLFTHIYNFQNNRVGDILPIFVEVSSQIQHTPLLPEMVELIKSLRLAGYRTILITNNFYTDRARLLPTVPSQVGLLFDDVLESCRLGLRKPDTKIYELALERSKLHPSDCVFLDDLGSNLKSAKEMGITTIKVVSSQQAIHDLGNILKLNFSYPPETRDCIPREVLPIEKINELITRRTGTDNKVETIRKFRHGQSNPTYYIRTVRGSQYVLRKKPSGSLLPKAHQVDREFKIMNALQGLVPLPKTLLYDETTLDTSFYLMEYQKGRIFLKPSLPELTPPERRRVYEEALKTLATIHSVDYEKVGLQDFGRTDGYMARNLKRWSDSYQMAKTEEIQEMIKLEAYLKANLPKSGKSTIVHGDFRVDNLIIEENEIKVKGVLDWELSTIGDPLSDLATFLFVYYVPNRMILLPGLGDYSESDLHRMGIPTIKECLELYAKYTNTEVVDPELWTYYMAFVIFRFASIIQGVYKRSQLKNASSTEASQLGPLVRKLAAEGMQMISKVHASKSYGQLTIIPSGMSLKAQKYYEIVREIIQNDVIPLEQELLEYYEEGPHRWTIPHPKIEKLKEKSKSLGAWNLFISEHIDPEQKYGKGLTNVEYAHICELMGRSIFAPEVFNCQAPDTGNMEVLIKYGSEEQKSKWLTPLLNGEIKSCFAMTEPDVASSDATNIQGSIVRVGNEYIINARKWFISNASHPKCRIAIFMGQVSGAKRSRNLQQSMILVPMQTEGVKIIRNTHVFGSQDAPGGHPEITFTNVRVPVGNMLLGEGKGFEIAQGRLGPGRIHHAMRLIGHAERAIDVIKDRLLTRIAFGRKLVQFDSLRKELALSRCEVEQARLLVLKAAHMIDTVGPKEAKSEIAMIKVVAPNMAISILDRAMQQQGARGLTPFTPLASFYVWARSLRIADGPDAVHLETIAKIEMKSRL
ncbi:Acyl-CoA dehydrogenase family member 11 [Caenorhabditis elegans]|uniref:Acyl-CoA dehydrogenase family member 11 n=1 Tax=Caenorhabditis elegans TaxID=6239 RepID=O01590_CAEEL|nr:APH domain-containing protein [Caenorhabditis elegans]CCD67873.1 APH domain-containing protein [Caenorhabditis elegans]|eukprot:NP_504508.1 ACaD (ACAD, acyl-CoA Dehydrogenase) Sequence homolog [Caenorhabditis elegans]